VVARAPDKIVLVGIRPERADPGLGYIEPGELLHGPEVAFRVAGFREKPNPQAAARIIAQGGLWNSFVMVFRAARVLDLVRAHRAPDYARMAAVNPTTYESLPTWNFSQHLLARAVGELVVVPAADTGWSDWGTPEAIERTLGSLKPDAAWRIRPGAIQAS
jgi:mannose-1-phosphate guanylyltransferase